MAQRIITLCDSHAAADEERPGVTWEVSVLAPGQTRPTTWEVDLCEDDGKTLEDLTAMLGAVGRVTDGPRKSRKGGKAARPAAEPMPGSPTATLDAKSGSPGHAVNPPRNAQGDYPCPVEGCDQVSISKTGLGTHLRKYHDTTLGEALGLPLPFVCKVAGCGKAFSSPQGLGAHGRAVHKLTSDSVGASARAAGASSEA